MSNLGKFGIGLFSAALLLLGARYHHQTNENLVNNLEATNSVTSGETSAGTYTEAIEHDGKTRSYLLHLPTGYSSQDSYPLVLVLHGGGGNNKNSFEKYKFGPKADQEGFIVVAPNGVDKNWNDGRGTTARESTADTVTDVDDVDFIDTLLNHIADSYAVDTTRVYATGVSNGSLMTQRLACELPNTFAAIAPSSGPMLKESITSICADSEPIAVVGFQATEDPFFPIDNSDGIRELPRILAQQGIQQTPVTAEEITAFWTEKNQCASTPEIENILDTANDGTFVTKYSFNDCLPGADVVYYIVDGAGHGWPGGETQGQLIDNINGGLTKNLDATDVAWDFFTQYSL